MAETLQIDPVFKSLIPPLSPEERQQLEENLKTDGCRDSLVAWNGLILDGHNRHEICERNGIKYGVKAIELPDRAAACIWIRWNQLGRRNLNDGQRAMQVAALVEELAEQSKKERARKGGETGGKNHPKVSLVDTSASKLKADPPKERHRTAASKKAGVSERKVKKAQTVRKTAPTLAAKVESGEMSLDAAYKQTVKQTKAAAKAAIPANLPAFTVRYKSEPWKMRVLPLNHQAKVWIQDCADLNELEYVQFLYRIRGRPVPPLILEFFQVPKPASRPPRKERPTDNQACIGAEPC